MIETEKRLARPLFRTEKKSIQLQAQIQNCHYCTIKKQFSGPSQKCLQHTINDNKSQFSEQLSPQEAILDRIYDLLLEADESLQQYWNNLYEYSEGDYQKVKRQLKPIQELVYKIQQRLKKFTLQQNRNYMSIDLKKNHHNDTNQQQRKIATRSQKFIASSFTQIFDQVTINQQIKEWVLYFHKILITKELQEIQLSLDEQIDMKIFKQSMEKKFLSFAKNYDRYQKRTAQALERLLFYMEQFGSDLSEEVLSKDFQFLEQNEEVFRPVQTPQFQRLLFSQALTIQHLLAQKEQQLQSSRNSRRS